MTDEPKQQLFHLEPATSSGTDENGVYDIIPLSMLRGGELSPTKVYKQPIKHVVTTSAPAIRGWYKDKTVEPRVRPRPCYSEALLTTPYGGFCHIGCKFCYVDHGTRGYRSTGVAAVNPGYPHNYPSFHCLWNNDEADIVTNAAQLCKWDAELAATMIVKELGY